MLSGANMENACFTYLTPHLPTSPIYTLHMAQKYDAINKYMSAKFTSQDAVVAYFREFVDLVNE